ncbi:MAG: hypothetical protein IJT24_03490 [Lachnospiraceae bacterium]|nr:hypothetical protein [Lachnospiraceae bacterium]
MIFELIDRYSERIAASVRMDNLRWSEYDGHMSYYNTQESKYRYLKYYLYQRLLLIREFCGIDDDIPELDLNTGETHTLKFIYDDEKTTEITVADGTHLNEGELPEYDREKYTGWYYEKDNNVISPCIPVYEDMAFVLRGDGDGEEEGASD